jgi:hypothetical protein
VGEREERDTFHTRVEAAGGRAEEAHGRNGGLLGGAPAPMHESGSGFTSDNIYA